MHIQITYLIIGASFLVSALIVVLLYLRMADVKSMDNEIRIQELDIALKLNLGLVDDRNAEIERLRTLKASGYKKACRLEVVLERINKLDPCIETAAMAEENARYLFWVLVCDNYNKGKLSN